MPQSRELDAPCCSRRPAPHSPAPPASRSWPWWSSPGRGRRRSGWRCTRSQHARCPAAGAAASRRSAPLQALHRSGAAVQGGGGTARRREGVQVLRVEAEIDEGVTSGEPLGASGGGAERRGARGVGSTKDGERPAFTAGGGEASASAAMSARVEHFRRRPPTRRASGRATSGARGAHGWRARPRPWSGERGRAAESRRTSAAHARATISAPRRAPAARVSCRGGCDHVRAYGGAAAGASVNARGGALSRSAEGLRRRRFVDRCGSFARAAPQQGDVDDPPQAAVVRLAASSPPSIAPAVLAASRRWRRRRAFATAPPRAAARRRHRVNGERRRRAPAGEGHGVVAATRAAAGPRRRQRPRHRRRLARIGCGARASSLTASEIRARARRRDRRRQTMGSTGAAPSRRRTRPAPQMAPAAAAAWRRGDVSSDAAQVRQQPAAEASAVG